MERDKAVLLKNLGFYDECRPAHRCSFDKSRASFVACIAAIKGLPFSIFLATACGADHHKMVSSVYYPLLA
jgi:hypothetical protein